MLILILLASLFVTLALGFFVLVAAPHRAVNRTFALFIGMMSLWIIKDLAFWGFHRPTEDAAWWAVVSFFIGLTLQIVFLHFTEVFPENAPPRWSRTILVSLPLLVFIPLLLMGKFWTHAHFHNGRFSIALTPFAYAAGIYNALMLAWGLAILWGKYRRHKGTLWGSQILSVIVAVLVTGILMVGSGNLLPALGHYYLLPFDSVFIVVGSLIGPQIASALPPALMASAFGGFIWFGAYRRTMVASMMDGIAYGLVTGALFAWLWPAG